MGDLERQRTSEDKPRAPQQPLVTALEVLGGAIFLLAVGIWMTIGIDPAIAQMLPRGVAAFGRPNAWWPLLLVGVSAVATVGLLRYLVPRASGAALAITLLGVCAAAIGVASYWPCSGDESPGWTAVRRTFDLFGGVPEIPFGEAGGGCPAVEPLGLQAARLMALIAILILAARTVALLFANRWAWYRARWASRVIVCAGVSEESLPAFRSLRDSLTGRQRLIVLDRTEDGRARRVTGDPRLLIVRLDYTDPKAVSRLLAGRRGPEIEGIHLLDADANVNLRTLESVTRRVRAQCGVSALGSRVRVRIDNPWHADDWRRNHLEGADGWLLDSVSAVEVAARHVVSRLLRDDVDVLVLAGSSPFELAVLSDLSFELRVSQAVDADHPVVLPRILLAGSHASDAALHLRTQLSRFNIAESGIDFVVHDGDLREAMTAGENPALLLGHQEDGDDYEPTYLASLNPRWRIYSWDNSTRGVTPSPLVGGMLLVGPTLEPVVGQGLDIWERFGIIAHRRYLATWFDGHPVVGDPARGRWDLDLTPFTKESNIRTFACVIGAVRQLGYRWSAGTELEVAARVSMSPEDLDTLAHAEHDSWVRHHEQHGWRVGSKRDDERRRHPLMVPWSLVADADREKDRQAVTATLELLGTLGFVLERAAPRELPAPPASRPSAPQPGPRFRLRTRFRMRWRAVCGSR